MTFTLKLKIIAMVVLSIKNRFNIDRVWLATSILASIASIIGVCYVEIYGIQKNRFNSALNLIPRGKMSDSEVKKVDFYQYYFQSLFPVSIPTTDEC